MSDRRDLPSGLRQCISKSKYKSQALALQVAAKCKRLRGAELSVYSCGMCGKWHLTKTPRKVQPDVAFPDGHELELIPVTAALSPQDRARIDPLRQRIIAIMQLPTGVSLHWIRDRTGLDRAKIESYLAELCAYRVVNTNVYRFPQVDS